MTILTVRIPEELDKILSEVAECQDLKNKQHELKVLEEFEKGIKKTYTIEEIAARNEIDWNKL